MHNSKPNQCMCSFMKVLRHTQGVLNIWVAYFIKQTLLKDLIITGAQGFEQDPPVLLACVQYAQWCPALCHPGLQPTNLLSLWNFPAKNAGAGCHFLGRGSPVSPVLAGIFLPLSHLGNPHLTWPCNKDFSAKRKQNKTQSLTVTYFLDQDVWMY